MTVDARSRICRHIHESFDNLDKALRDFNPTYRRDSDESTVLNILDALRRRVGEMRDDNVLDLIRSHRDHNDYPLDVGNGWPPRLKPLFDSAWRSAYAILTEPATFFSLEDSVAYFEGVYRAYTAVTTSQPHVRAIFISLVSVLRDVEDRIAKRPPPSAKAAAPRSFRPRLLSIGPLAHSYGALLAFMQTAPLVPGIPPIEAATIRAVEVFIEKYPKYLTFLESVQEFCSAVGEALAGYILINLEWQDLHTLECAIVRANGDRDSYFNTAVGAGMQLEAEQIINPKEAEPKREPE
jgi:hypothetical protein